MLMDRGFWRTGSLVCRNTHTHTPQCHFDRDTGWLSEELKMLCEGITSPEDSEKKQLVLKSWTRAHAGT